MNRFFTAAAFSFLLIFGLQGEPKKLHEELVQSLKETLDALAIPNKLSQWLDEKDRKFEEVMDLLFTFESEVAPFWTKDELQALKAAFFSKSAKNKYIQQQQTIIRFCDMESITDMVKSRMALFKPQIISFINEGSKLTGNVGLLTFLDTTINDQSLKLCDVQGFQELLRCLYSLPLPSKIDMQPLAIMIDRLTGYAAHLTMQSESSSEEIRCEEYFASLDSTINQCFSTLDRDKEVVANAIVKDHNESELTDLMRIDGFSLSMLDDVCNVHGSVKGAQAFMKKFEVYAAGLKQKAEEIYGAMKEKLSSNESLRDTFYKKFYAVNEARDIPQGYLLLFKERELQEDQSKQWVPSAMGTEIEHYLEFVEKVFGSSTSFWCHNWVKEIIKSKFIIDVNIKDQFKKVGEFFAQTDALTASFDLTRDSLKACDIAEYLESLFELDAFCLPKAFRENFELLKKYEKIKENLNEKYAQLAQFLSTNEQLRRKLYADHFGIQKDHVLPSGYLVVGLQEAREDSNTAEDQSKQDLRLKKSGSFKQGILKFTYADDELSGHTAYNAANRYLDFIANAIHTDEDFHGAQTFLRTVINQGKNNSFTIENPAVKDSEWDLRLARDNALFITLRDKQTQSKVDELLDIDDDDEEWRDHPLVKLMDAYSDFEKMRNIHKSSLNTIATAQYDGLYKVYAQRVKQAQADLLQVKKGEDEDYDDFAEQVEKRLEIQLKTDEMRFAAMSFIADHYLPAGILTPNLQDSSDIRAYLGCLGNYYQSIQTQLKSKNKEVSLEQLRRIEEIEPQAHQQQKPVEGNNLLEDRSGNPGSSLQSSDMPSLLALVLVFAGGGYALSKTERGQEIWDEIWYEKLGRRDRLYSQELLVSKARELYDLYKDFENRKFDKEVFKEKVWKVLRKYRLSDRKRIVEKAKRFTKVISS